MSYVITQPITLRLDLDPEYSNGTDALIGSDESWKCTTDGPTRFNGILAG